MARHACTSEKIINHKENTESTKIKKVIALDRKLIAKTFFVFSVFSLWLIDIRVLLCASVLSCCYILHHTLTQIE